MVLGTWPGRGGTGRRTGHGAGGAKASCPRDTLGHRARVFIAGGSGRFDRARAVWWYRRARGRRRLGGGGPGQDKPGPGGGGGQAGDDEGDQRRRPARMLPVTY
jgi:hypothetical protein